MHPRILKIRVQISLFFQAYLKKWRESAFGESKKQAMWNKIFFQVSKIFVPYDLLVDAILATFLYWFTASYPLIVETGVREKVNRLVSLARVSS